MADVPGTNSRAKTFALSAAATNNSTSVKSSPGFVFSVAFSSTKVGTATMYLKLYDKATAPTVGTDRPVLVLPVLQSSVTAAAGYASVSIPEGVRFTLGIGLALTLGAADTDNTSIAVAHDAKVLLTYK